VCLDRFAPPDLNRRELHLHRIVVDTHRGGS
jgi:hypothetical protein